MIKNIKITTEYITLAQFLKLADLINSGGEAKIFLATHDVFINDELDVRRGRKLYLDDVVVIEGKSYKIC